MAGLIIASITIILLHHIIILYILSINIGIHSGVAVLVDGATARIRWLLSINLLLIITLMLTPEVLKLAQKLLLLPLDSHLLLEVLVELPLLFFGLSGLLLVHLLSQLGFISLFVFEGLGWVHLWVWWIQLEW